MKKLMFILILLLMLVSCEKKEENDEYIIYNTNGGEKLEPQLITDDLKLLIPDKKGYIFTGWKDDEGKYVSENDITSSIHLNAEYYQKKRCCYLIVINVTSTSTEYLYFMKEQYGEAIVPTIDIDYYCLSLDGKPYEYGNEIILDRTRKLVIYS